jgi:uncharacterized protein (DUF488 family)
MRAILTVGHGTLGTAAFLRLVTAAGIEAIADVRQYPASRRHPQFGRAEMAGWLGSAGLGYHWLPALGGRRRLQPGSPNLGLRHPQFRAYADHMATAEFAAGVADLLALADTQVLAAMCAESVWWRCHRRLLADHLVLVAERPVEHLLPDGRRQTHVPTPTARRAGSTVRYDVGAQETLFDS